MTTPYDPDAGARPAEPALAPHVRAPIDLAGVMRANVAAVLPAALVGVHSAGARASEALAATGLERAAGWRGATLDALGLGIDPASTAAALAHGALHFLPVLAAVWLVGAAWQELFGRVRRRVPQPGLFLVALLFALALPPTIPLWQAAAGMSFGLVVGRELFGGTGRNLVHPVLAGLAFLYFAYPAAMRGEGIWVAVEGAAGSRPIELAATGGLAALGEAGVEWRRAFVGSVPGAFGDASALACLAGAAILVALRLVSWRILAGVLVGAGVAAALFRAAAPAGMPMAELPLRWHLALGSFAFGAAFLATDPATAAGTDAGRWIVGMLVGALVVLFRVANPLHADGTMLALLCGNVFAPLVDHGVLALHRRRRARRLRP